jgi:hypothetical protein
MERIGRGDRRRRRRRMEGLQDFYECWDINAVLRRKGICYYVQFQVAIPADVLFKLMLN